MTQALSLSSFNHSSNSGIRTLPPSRQVKSHGPVLTRADFGAKRPVHSNCECKNECALAWCARTYHAGTVSFQYIMVACTSTFHTFRDILKTVIWPLGSTRGYSTYVHIVLKQQRGSGGYLLLFFPSSHRHPWLFQP